MTVGPRHAAVALWVEAPGYVPAEVPGAVAGRGAEPVHVRLCVAAEVSGRAVDAAGAPSAGAVVALSRDLGAPLDEHSAPRRHPIPRSPPDGVQFQRTGAGGTFALATGEGLAWMRVSAPGAPDRLLAVSAPVADLAVSLEEPAPPTAGVLQGALPATQTRFVAFVPGADAPQAPTFALPRGATQLVDLGAIPGAAVDGAWAEEDGAFALTRLPRGRFELRAWSRARLAIGESPPVRPGDALTLSLAPTGWLRITVEHADPQDATTGTYVVRAAGQAPIAWEASTGMTRTVRVSAGVELEVLLFVDGHAPAAARVSVPQGGDQDVHLTPRRGGGYVSLAIAYPERPVEVVELSWRDPSVGLERTRRLAAVSRWSLDGVGEGRFDLRARIVERAGRATRTREVTTPVVSRAGEVTRVELDLR